MPALGHTTGPNLVSVRSTVPQGSSDALITYTFDQTLDATPTQAPANGVFNSPTTINNAFGYYGANGNVVTCGNLDPSATAAPGVSISARTVTCRIPASTYQALPPAQYFVLAKAVRDRPTDAACCDVNPIGFAAGTARLSRPTIQSVQQTGLTQLTVTYSEPVTVEHLQAFTLYASDGGSLAPQSSTQPTADTVVLDFPAAFANAAYKAVAIADPGAAAPGGAAVQSTAGAVASATSYVGFRTAPTEAGRIDAPLLSAVSVDPTKGQATFTFLGLVRALNRTQLGAKGLTDFHLVDQAANFTSATSLVGITLGSPTAADPTSQVTVQFPAAAVASAKAAQVLDYDAQDYQNKLGLRNTVAVTVNRSPRPRVTIVGSSATVSKAGVVVLAIRCPAATRCQGVLRLRLRTDHHPVIALVKVNVAAHFRGRIRLQLNRLGRQRLAHARGHRMSVIVAFRGSAGNYLLVDRTLTLVRR